MCLCILQFLSANSYDFCCTNVSLSWLKLFLNILLFLRLFLNEIDFFIFLDVTSLNQCIEI